MLIILVNNEECKIIAKERETKFQVNFNDSSEYFVSCFDTIYHSVNKS